MWHLGPYTSEKLEARRLRGVLDPLEYGLHRGEVGEFLDLEMGCFGRRKTQGRVFGAEKSPCGNGDTQFLGFQ